MSSASWSPTTGNWVVTTSGNTARIWRASDWQQVQKFTHDAAVYTGMFNSNETHVLLGTATGPRIFYADVKRLATCNDPPVSAAACAAVGRVLKLGAANATCAAETCDVASTPADAAACCAVPTTCASTRFEWFCHSSPAPGRVYNAANANSTCQGNPCTPEADEGLCCTAAVTCGASVETNSRAAFCDAVPNWSSGAFDPAAFCSQNPCEKAVDAMVCCATPGTCATVAFREDFCPAAGLVYNATSKDVPCAAGSVCSLAQDSARCCAPAVTCSSTRHDTSFCGPYKVYAASQAAKSCKANPCAKALDVPTCCDWPVLCGSVLAVGGTSASVQGFCGEGKFFDAAKTWTFCIEKPCESARDRATCCTALSTTCKDARDMPKSKQSAFCGFGRVYDHGKTSTKCAVYPCDKNIDRLSCCSEPVQCATMENTGTGTGRYHIISK